MRCGINDGAHLTEEGLIKVVSIKASMNKGLSPKLKTIFPNITPVKRSFISDQEIPNGNWVSGFADGESSFYVRIQEALTAKSRNRISFFFAIEQSIRDSSLMERLKEYLNCGTTSSNEKYIHSPSFFFFF